MKMAAFSSTHVGSIHFEQPGATKPIHTWAIIILLMSDSSSPSFLNLLFATHVSAHLHQIRYAIDLVHHEAPPGREFPPYKHRSQSTAHECDDN
jgi:hypothetical protein